MVLSAEFLLDLGYFIYFMYNFLGLALVSDAGIVP